MPGAISITKSDQRRRRAQVLRLTHSALKELLEFKTVYDIQYYLNDKNARDWREFEEETANQVFEGAGVIATRDNVLLNPERDEDTYYHADVPLGSHETGAYILGFPLAAASASYVFTLLEGFGDEIAGVLQPGSINRNKAWHEDIKGFADLRDPVQMTKARAAFAKHFGAEPVEVPEIAARRMVELKRVRNDFAHDGRGHVDLPSYLADTIAVVCHIAFLVTDEKRISIYPWEDHEDRFAPKSAY